MTGYFDYSGNRFGTEAKQRLRRIFHAFGWPDAAPGEYVGGRESALLFFNRYGLVLRTGEHMPCPEHDLILQPLLATPPFAGENGCDVTIELLPGVDGVVRAPEECHALRELLLAGGIDFHDCAIHNAGYIRTDIPGLPGGLPVVIDRGSVCNAMPAWAYNYHPPPCKTVFDIKASAGVQERLYAPLRTALRAAWPESGRPHREALAGFLALCEAEIHKRSEGRPALLSNGWVSSATDFDKPYRAVAAGAAYEHRLATRDFGHLIPNLSTEIIHNTARRGL